MCCFPFISVSWLLLAVPRFKWKCQRRQTRTGRGRKKRQSGRRCGKEINHFHSKTFSFLCYHFDFDTSDTSTETQTQHRKHNRTENRSIHSTMRSVPVGDDDDDVMDIVDDMMLPTFTSSSSFCVCWECEMRESDASLYSCQLLDDAHRNLFTPTPDERWVLPR